MTKSPKTLRTEILELIGQARREMDLKEGHVCMNPHSPDDWATRLKELSKDIELSAVARQDMQLLNQVLEMATLCVACLEEHIGYKMDELMPEFEMHVSAALNGATETIFSIKKNTGDAATSPAGTVH